MVINGNKWLICREIVFFVSITSVLCKTGVLEAWQKQLQTVKPEASQLVSRNSLTNLK